RRLLRRGLGLGLGLRLFRLRLVLVLGKLLRNRIGLCLRRLLFRLGLFYFLRIGPAGLARRLHFFLFDDLCGFILDRLGLGDFLGQWLRGLRLRGVLAAGANLRELARGDQTNRQRLRESG